MSSRKMLLCVSLLFALLSSPTAENVCYYTTIFAANCTELSLVWHFRDGFKGSINLSQSLKSFNLSAQTFTNLTTINLENNDLTEMPHLPQSAKLTIQELCLVSNNIASIPANYFNDFPRLTGLDLSSNEFTVIPRLSRSAQAILQWLDLSGNNIASVPTNYFSGSTNLLRLSLAHNKLTEMPPLHPSAKASLKQLQLFRNKIAAFPNNYFNDFRSLTELVLYSNRLTAMPALLDSAKAKLSIFSIFDNAISAIPAGYFKGFSEVKFITFEENEIAGFSPGNSLKHLGKLAWLHVDQMDCDCTTQRVWQEIAEMPNITDVRVYKNGQYTQDLQCDQDLQDTDCTPKSPFNPPRTAAPPTDDAPQSADCREWKRLVIAIGVPLLIGVILLAILCSVLVFRRGRSSPAETGFEPAAHPAPQECQPEIPNLYEEPNPSPPAEETRYTTLIKQEKR